MTIMEVIVQQMVTPKATRLTPPVKKFPAQHGSATSGFLNNSASGTVTTNGTLNSTTAGGGSSKIPSDILDDLASRFIINVPDDERNNLIRICFQIELAHWFYLDFFCAIEERKLVSVGIKQFAMHLFQHIPFLRKHLSTVDKILDDWKNYKLSVPTYGAILISEDLRHVLLVQSYWAKSSWGFPKGKVNEHEDPVHCATREVYEETGYDITGLIVPNDYVDGVINFQYTRLYIVRNVPLQTHFSPRTRNEIKCCEWFPVDSLPINKNDAISKQKLGINANSFFMIMPFIKRLKKWVIDNRSGIEKIRKTSSSSSSNSPITTYSGSNCRKEIENNFKIYNESNALNENNNINGGNGGCKKAKRQRHKSMGDIDGIKLSLSSNNCKLSSGTTSKNPTTPNTDNCGESFFANNSINGSLSAVKRNERQAKSTNYNSNSTKRQLFNYNLVDSDNAAATGVNNTGSRKSLSSFDIIRREKQQQQQLMKSIEKCEKKANNFRSRTKSQGCGGTSVAPLQNAKQIKVQILKRPVVDGKSTPPTSLPVVSKSSSPSASAATVRVSTEATATNQILKFNPNFDSWTNFSFTRNFIANVFC